MLLQQTLREALIMSSRVTLYSYPLEYVGNESLLIVRVQRSSPWQHASIHPGLVSLIFIPSLYSLFLNQKIFHLLVILTILLM